MNKKILFGFLCASFFVVNSVLAFQFEDFVWGESIDSIYALLKKNKKRVLPDKNGRGISYKDKILENECVVALFFTPKSSLLYMVKLRWKTPLIGDKLKRILIQNYGIPVQNEKSVEQYVWFGNSEEEMLALDYSGGITELLYSAADVYANNDANTDKRIEAGDRF